MDSLDTRRTLLSRVRAGDDHAAWRQFEAMYRDMLLRFCRVRGLQHADAEDILQAVFTKLVTGLERFEYDPAKGRFRDYLHRCVRSAIADAAPRRRGWSTLEGEPHADDADSARAWEREWVNHHYRLAIAEVRRTAEPRSVDIFEATLAGRKTGEIAASLGMSEAAVYKVQHRMRDRMKEQIARQVRAEDGLDE